MTETGEGSSPTGRDDAALVRFDSVVKEYPGSGRALDDVSFQLGQGEFAFLTGPSGAGKTTALKLIHMEEMPTEGEVRVARFASRDLTRQEVPMLRRRVGFVFQDFRLLDRLTAAENVAFALEATGADRSEIDSRVRRLLEQVGLSSRAGSHPAELSGGERQRVAVARALATDPLILLADEPTGNLDESAASGVLDLFRDAHRRGTAVLLATHDPGLLRRRPESRVLELDDGRLVTDSGRAAT